MNYVVDGGGGGGTYNPAAEFSRTEVDMEVTDIKSLASALKTEQANIASARAVIDKYFAQGDGDAGEPPLGSDPRYVGVQSLVNYHNSSMQNANELLAKYELGIQAISRITNKIIHDLVDTDRINSDNLTEADVRDVTGIPEPPPPPPYGPPGGPQIPV